MKDVKINVPTTLGEVKTFGMGLFTAVDNFMKKHADTAATKVDAIVKEMTADKEAKKDETKTEVK